jgi:hypothetical protein
MADPNPPILSQNPNAELEKLIARSIELNTEGLAINKRIRELHQQLAQRERNSETGDGPTIGER